MSLCSRFILAAALLGGAAVNAQASIIAYDNSPTTGASVFGGSVGLDFTVNSAISVSALGVFDNGSSNNLAGLNGGGVSVAIFNIGTQSEVSPVVSFTSSSAGTQINADAFKTVTPFTLAPGSYTVIAAGADIFNSLGATNTSSTTNSGGGLISFVGGGRYNPAAGLNFAGTVDGGPANRYDAGTFQFASTAVAEPATFALLGTGLLALALTRRRTT